jgi:ribulose-phosphate 3-epimerase
MVKEFQNAGCDLYYFHYKAAISNIAAKSLDATGKFTTNPEEMFRYIQDYGMLSGIVIKPETEVNIL